MTAGAVSVIIVSRGRPKDLLRCLTALRYQTLRHFEVVVVTDPTSMAALRASPLFPGLKAVAFDEANISAARNIGIDHAAGEILAFLDDDAIAEPPWLERLVAPFATHDIAATAGWVRSTNGFDYRWRGDWILPWGELRAFVSDGVQVFGPDHPYPVLTIGANCAFRRAALVGIGGFDPNFRIGLDDADVNMRLTRAGQRMAIVAAAQVHHIPAAGPYRNARRVPLTLEQGGASFGWWFTKYARPEHEFTPIRRFMRDTVLANRIRRGHLDAATADRLAEGFARGFAEGRGRAPVPVSFAPVPPAFHPFPTLAVPPGHTVLSGRPWSRRRLFAEAAARAARGEVVTVLILSPTALYHQRRYHDQGFWTQQGGLFGRSRRSDPLLRWYRFSSRVARETADLAPMRLPRG